MFKTLSYNSAHAGQQTLSYNSAHAGQQTLSYRSAHAGFSRPINPIFQARFHFLRAFSLVMALSMDP